ncbi:MAG: hypothetical protein F6J98_49290 [Moorea sp. SIO4G2]|uniref:hypothetical protein n=1 Tax=Moorena sp. SIO4A5 TaxID=2607838 RepID=UPI0013C9AA2A|nr:hypothetical protein [Moorena sp. SIO4A5]NEO24975.1 hypothetical protein [Moorena sp. SIO4A5]NEO67917.1 hypothetical protein [Moorena sp. SIO4G2]
MKPIITVSDRITRHCPPTKKLASDRITRHCPPTKKLASDRITRHCPPYDYQFCTER